MPAVALERTLVKSPPELWHVLAAGDALSRRLGAVRVEAARAPHILEWENDVARGVLELEASGWGTTVRARADVLDASAAVDVDAEVARRLEGLLDDLGSSALSAG